MQCKLCLRPVSAPYFGPCPECDITVSLGGGVDSTAAIIEMISQGVKINRILFGDTGGEKKPTYIYIQEVFKPWLAARGYSIVDCRYANQNNYDTLEEECLNKETLPSIVFGFRSCSDKWKVRAQNQYLRELPEVKHQWANDFRIVRAVCYDAGEAHRASSTGDDRNANWFPLIEWGIDRDEAKQIILAAGLPLPPKSACFFCPSSTKPEVIQLSKDSPEEFNRAIEMERLALASGNLKQVRGLGRHWSWEELVKGVPQAIAAPETVPVSCVCNDGSDVDD